MSLSSCVSWDAEFPSIKQWYCHVQEVYGWTKALVFWVPLILLIILRPFPELWCISQHSPQIQNQEDIYIDIDIKELTYADMEVAKSQDLQGESASWRPRRADGLVPVQVWSLENQDWQWCSSSSKADKFETQKDPMFQFESKGRKKLMSQFEGY